MVKKAETNEIVIPALDIRSVTLHIVGDTPLIVHKWSEKAKREILDKQMKKAVAKKHDAKDPVADFIDTLYWIEGEPEEKNEAGFEKAIENGARVGFPSTAFKQSAIVGSQRSGVDIVMTQMRGAIHIDEELIEIHGDISMREDMVKVGMGTADIRHRAQISNWWCDINVKYNAGVISAEQIAMLFNIGGFACGVGEWRIEKDGIFGAYHVE